MSYDDHLDRALSKAPTAEVSSERFDVPEPVVRAEGNVTVYENFPTTLSRLNREERHVLKFLQNELGTSAQIDERGRARLTGDFRQDRIGDALDAYVETYVLCPECGLPDTRLEYEDGTEFLRCEACGARSSVDT